MYWLVTTPDAKDHHFTDKKSMVAFLRDNPGSMVSWITVKKKYEPIMSSNARRQELRDEDRGRFYADTNENRELLVTPAQLRGYDARKLEIEQEKRLPDNLAKSELKVTKLQTALRNIVDIARSTPTKILPPNGVAHPASAALSKVHDIAHDALSD